MNKLYKKLSFLLIFSLFACASSQSTFTAANDEDKDIGIGGTGMLANTDSSISSTSGSGLGGTGILGEITGFGSVFVNGVEIEYDSDTTFRIDGITEKSPQLQIGDVVEVLTVDAKQHTQAQVINLRHEVIGVVESVEPKTYSFTVHGQRIIQAIHKVSQPEVGETVAVSGFRIDEKTILSTRVTPAASGQSLLRTRTELPFSKRAERWLVQTHTQDGKASFKVNDKEQVFSVDEKMNNTFKEHWGIKIMQLQKSAKEILELERVVDPVGMPQGLRTLNPVQQNSIDTLRMPMPGRVQTPLTGSSPLPVMTQPNVRQGR